MTHKFAIIADDLTGALDSAAPFAARGMASRVYSGPEALPLIWPEDCAVIAVSTNSREIDIAAAVSAVHRASRHLLGLGAEHLFKKVDSRLKGHVAAEVAACAAVFAHSQITVIPAIPSFERRVSSGMLYGAGIGQPIDVRARVGTIGDIPDTITDEDFDAPVARFLAARGKLLMVGARGAAEALARVLSTLVSPVSPARGSVLIVVGSVDPITRVQLHCLKQYCEREPQDTEHITILATPDLSGPLDVDTARRFALGVVAHLKRENPQNLVVTGGETARHLLNEMGASELLVEGEILPGIAQTQAIIEGKAMRILTKSGGFGSETTLVDLCEAMIGRGNVND